MQMGRALTIIARAEASEIVMHEDVSAYHAPSECHRDVSRGEEARRRTARRHAKSVSGLSRRQFNSVLKTVSSRVLQEAVSRIHAKISPFH